MATVILPAATARLSQSVDIDITRLWRAHVEPADWRGPERTAFVEALNPLAARRKIAAVVAALEYRTPEEVEDRIYNVTSAAELIEQGLSEDHAVRLFETGWSGGCATHFVQSPLVLLADPGPLLRIWATLLAPSPKEGPSCREAQP